MANRIIAAASGSVKGKKIAVLGVAFKPNTDDMRDAVALDVIPALQKAGALVQAFDPVAMKEAAKLLPNVAWMNDAYEALDGACVAAILTEWNEFRALDLPRAKTLMTSPSLVDLRNIYKPEEMREAGFVYTCIGRQV
jgi:UDPglucose 6-dehydrogenase